MRMDGKSMRAMLVVFGLINFMVTAGLAQTPPGPMETESHRGCTPPPHVATSLQSAI